jgi:5-methylcytosine-specific restriction endonuclease McrA
MKTCKFCGKQDDGTVPFVHDQKLCIACRNEQKRLKYNTDSERRQTVLENNKKSKTKIWSKEKENAYQEIWRKENKDRSDAIKAKYRASKFKASPSWLSDTHKEQIEVLYLLRDFLSEITNKSYHVDHIIPLQGKEVSGLHVPWNLQILEASENIRKKNKLLVKDIVSS